MSILYTLESKLEVWIGKEFSRDGMFAAELHTFTGSRRIRPLNLVDDNLIYGKGKEVTKMMSRPWRWASSEVEGAREDPMKIQHPELLEQFEQKLQQKSGFRQASQLV